MNDRPAEELIKFSTACANAVIPAVRSHTADALPVASSSAAAQLSILVLTMVVRVRAWCSSVHAACGEAQG